jgi:hypothetical protein
MMKNLQFICLTILISFLTQTTKGQTIEQFDIVSFTPPAGWVKETGKGFIAYTKVNETKGEYARILLYASEPATGNVDADFDTEWLELVKPNYNPGALTDVSTSNYKDGWIAKIGVAPFKFKNQNHAVVLNTLVKNKIKMSNVFISNTVAYQADFEDFGSSLLFGAGHTIQNQQNQLQRNEPAATKQSMGIKSEQKNQPAYSQSSDFTYTTSNFDDGWTATIQNDYVLVNKGNARVFLYYAVPYNSDNFSGTGVMDRDYYWDNYVAKQFKITTKQYKDDGEFISSLKPKYVEGRGMDPETGETRFIAMTLTVAPNTAQITVASFPDEATFRQTFPNANGKFTSDLTEMSRYNKFAIDINDLAGTWQSGGSQMLQWYDGITGAYAGATMAASSATFTFSNAGTYSSIHNGATGAVGAMNTFQQEYKGALTVSNWNMVLTNRWQGETSNFEAHYQAVRGGRLLYLSDNAGSSYLLVKIK